MSSNRNYKMSRRIWRRKTFVLVQRQMESRRFWSDIFRPSRVDFVIRGVRTQASRISQADRCTVRHSRTESI